MAKNPVKKKPPAKKVPRAAKDLKPGDSRASYLKKATEKKAKPPSGTLTDRMGEAKSRPNKGLPARVDKSRGNLNRANPPKEIRMGGQGGTGRSLTRAAYLDKFKPVPLGDRPALLSGPKVKGGGVGNALARGAFRAVGGPATMLVSMTTEAGSGSDKPSGKLFSPSQNRAAGKGNPKTVNPYKKRKDVVGRNPNEGMGVPSAKSAASAKAAVARDSYFTDVPSYTGTKKSGSYFKDVPSYTGTKKSGSYFKDVPSYTGVKPSVSTANASEFKKKNLKANQKVGKKVMASESTAKAPKAPSFKGNWTGATPTEMQKKGGQRIKRPNLLSLFRGKR